jgi:hypothetical protein
MCLSRFSSDSSQIGSDTYKKEKETPKHKKNLLYTILNLGKIKQKNTEKIYVIWRKQLSQTMTVYNHSLNPHTVPKMCQKLPTNGTRPPVHPRDNHPPRYLTGKVYSNLSKC